eukprot:TRINITY_DN10993_c0_g1_i2.p1 TRINITY_DN10993_c0_g1~~TRINITY_DN10993_c0_g1_i2.p1  ORF type:complete len:361 (-),score=2.83 TRINITY_DN10993_c0_g1_i2:108-1190(-)
MVTLCAFPTYIGKELCKLYPRISLEFAAEWHLFKEKWKVIVTGIIFQFIHGFLTRTAHILHEPRPLLHDIGFVLIPELGPEHFYISEILWAAVFVPFILWTFLPFVSTKKLFYTVLLWTKMLVVLVICQMLRVLSFTATQLPGPAHHCREGQPTARLEYHSIWDVLQLNVLHSCGDLIFSSHMTFMLTFIITYTKYGTTSLFKYLAWLAAVAQSVLIVASRKHYTVDVVIAWYVVPLVYYFVDHRLQDLAGPCDVVERTFSEKCMLLHSNSGRPSPNRGDRELVAHLMGGFKDMHAKISLAHWLRASSSPESVSSEEDHDGSKDGDIGEPLLLDDSRNRIDVVVDLSKAEAQATTHSGLS